MHRQTSHPRIPIAPGKAISGSRPYWLLLALQTVGTALLYWEGVPIYRNTMSHPGAYEAETTVTALGACALIQVAYWIGYRTHPALPRFRNVLLGHALIFFSKMILVFPSAVVSLLFVAKDFAVQIPPSRYAFMIFALFSLFCYAFELERMGGRFLNYTSDL